MDQETGRPTPAQVKPAAEYDDEIDLVAYVLTLWRWKWLVLAGACLCGAAAFALSSVSAPTYEATLKLVVAPPKTSQVGESTPTVTVASFRALVENQSIAAKIVSEFGLGKPPLNLTPRAFLQSRLTVEAVRDTNIVAIRVRMPDADLAAKVANRFGQLAVELAQQLNQDETVRARDTIRDQLDVSRKRLDDAEARLEQLRREAQIEALRKDVETVLGQRAGLLPLLVEIQTEKARLSKAEEQLAARDRIGTLKRTIDNEPALMEAARETAGGRSGLLGLETKNEYLNGVYESLDQQVTASRTRLAALEKQKTELIDVRKLDSTQLALLNQLYSRETELDRLQTEFGLAKQIYVDVSTRYEQARLQVAGRSAQLQVADAALVPDRPVGPRVMRNTALALVVGVILSVIGVFLLELLSAAAARARA